jgi:hypothetical protein
MDKERRNLESASKNVRGRDEKEDVAVVRNIILKLRKHKFLHKQTIKGVKWIQIR